MCHSSTIPELLTLSQQTTLFCAYIILLQVYGWGRGEHGRLGFGDNDKSSKMVPQRVHLLAGQDIVQVRLQLFLVTPLNSLDGPYGV